MAENLLPTSSTPWERALANALDGWGELDAAIDVIRTAKLVAPLPAFLPFLVYEYGLGELTPYVPSLYQLLAEGVRWQRVRGTPASLEMGLDWLGYSARIEEECHLRRHWNMLQLDLDRVRDVLADLNRIAGVTQLSLPKRSLFWRGFHGFDIRPMTYSHRQWSGAHWSQCSGVRVGGKGPLWSFGRNYRFAHVLSKAELVELNVWIDVDPSDWAAGDIGWDDFAWEDSEATWQSDLALARSQAMAGAAMAMPVLVAFFSGDNVVGYRRARIRRFVHAEGNGCYVTPAGAFAPSQNPDRFVYVEALTDFGDGLGASADHAAVVFDVSAGPDVPPGRAWLGPEEVSGPGIVIAQRALSITFGESIRERVSFLLDFDGPPENEM